MEHEEEHKIYYKIVPDRKYMVFKNTVNDVDYYKICISQKNIDGTTDRFYKDVRFKKGISLKNETVIVIKKAYENYRKNPKDQYNGISYLNIIDFDMILNEQQKEEIAYDEYQNKEDTITEDMLPF